MGSWADEEASPAPGPGTQGSSYSVLFSKIREQRRMRQEGRGSSPVDWGQLQLLQALQAAELPAFPSPEGTKPPAPPSQGRSIPGVPSCSRSQLSRGAVPIPKFGSWEDADSTSEVFNKLRSQRLAARGIATANPSRAGNQDASFPQTGNTPCAPAGIRTGARDPACPEQAQGPGPRAEECCSPSSSGTSALQGGIMIKMEGEQRGSMTRRTDQLSFASPLPRKPSRASSVWDSRVEGAEDDEESEQDVSFAVWCPAKHGCRERDRDRNAGTEEHGLGPRLVRSASADTGASMSREFFGEGPGQPGSRLDGATVSMPEKVYIVGKTIESCKKLLSSAGKATGRVIRVLGLLVSHKNSNVIRGYPL